MKDFLIVGQGLAATVLMQCFHQHGLSFTAIGNGGLSNCSRVAAGIWNPVVFKRMTKSWLADELIPTLHTFYKDCELRLGKTLMTERPLLKPFTEEQEKRLWQRKSELELRGYLDPELHTEPGPGMEHLKISNGYGRVLRCGNLDVAAFMDATLRFFGDQVVHETFQYDQLQVLPDKVIYGALEARSAIFCEGHLVSQNPFFNWIPLKPAKGEVLTVSMPGPGLSNAIFNRNGFLMDTAPGVYKTGATYEWQQLSDAPTGKGRGELIAKLEQMTGSTYTILKQEAGIRPSSIDRRPLIGRHPRHANLYVMNGLGTKGVMLAPFFAQNFVHFYQQKQKIHPEAELSRFYSLYEIHQA